MVSESKLKTQMLAAIAKKKKQVASARASVSPEPAAVSQPAEEASAPIKSPPLASAKPTDLSGVPILRNDVDWSRTFFGHPIRIAVHQKKVFYALPDVMGVACTPEEAAQFSELYDNPSTQKILAPMVSQFRFTSPNGGQDILLAAEAEAMAIIFKQLKLTNTIAISEWLTKTTSSLMAVIG